VAYLELRIGERTLFGVGIDSNIVSASFKAIVSGLQRAEIRNDIGDRSSALSPRDT
jgi:2-isopropylmalate synthase